MIGCVIGYILARVDDMLVAGSNDVLGLFVEAVTKHWKITQGETIGPGRKGEITHTGMWIATVSGRYVLHQCPYVSEVSRVGERKIVDGQPLWEVMNHGDNKRPPPSPQKVPSQEEVRVAQKGSGALLWLSSRSRPDLGLLGITNVKHAHKEPIPIVGNGKETLSVPNWHRTGTADHGLVLKPTSEWNGTLTDNVWRRLFASWSGIHWSGWSDRWCYRCVEIDALIACCFLHGRIRGTRLG